MRCLSEFLREWGGDCLGCVRDTCLALPSLSGSSADPPAIRFQPAKAARRERSAAARICESLNNRLPSPSGGSSARKTARWAVFSENGPAGPREVARPQAVTDEVVYSRQLLPRRKKPAEQPNCLLIHLLQSPSRSRPHPSFGQIAGNLPKIHLPLKGKAHVSPASVNSPGFSAV